MGNKSSKEVKASPTLSEAVSLGKIPNTEQDTQSDLELSKQTPLPLIHSELKETTSPCLDSSSDTPDGNTSKETPSPTVECSSAGIRQSPGKK